MIAKLRGVVDALGPDWVVVDVGGVGYLARCSTRTREGLPTVGEAVALLIETQVREDSIALYGFADAAEREWFVLLQTVQGVGARVALALLGALGPEGLASAIGRGEGRLLSRANGVGARLAARIANELKGKVPTIADGVSADGAPVRSGVVLGGGAESDAVSALMNLGYREQEAQQAVGAARRRLGEAAAVAELIRGGLKELAS
jgi:Holliday junction DNA helicase RuvA